MSWLSGKTLVAPFDFSDESQAAVDYALQLADDPSQIRVIHVLAALPASSPAEMWQTTDDATRGERARATLAERFTDPRYGSVNLHVALGDPGHEIVEYAQQVGAGLIVLPSHGRTGVKRLLILSVAERVVRLAHCPVLVIRS